MSDFITQDNRLLAVITNAGKDVLLLDSFDIREGVSQPFTMTLHMVAEVEAGSPAKVKPHELVGTSFSVKLKLSDAMTGIDNGERYFTGMCARFSQERMEDQRFVRFTAVLVPWLSFLHYATNCRIFQDKTAVDIIQEVVADHGYSGLIRFDLAKSYIKLDYCVQYRETDMDFLMRLMASEGIYFYFEHTNGKHVMVLADAPAQYKPLPNLSTLKYAPALGNDATEDAIRSWQVEEVMHTGKWSYRDFHHESPHNFFDSMNASPDVAAAGAKFETYDYPGGYAKKFNKVGSVGGVPAEGDKLTRLRMEQEETGHTLMGGESTYRVMASGYRVNVTGGAAEGSYFITQVIHQANQAPGYSNTEPDQPYLNRFNVIPSARPFVPALRTHPGIHGLQTAFVIDESQSGNAEEIWPDKYGRVRVRFHWDREMKYACWLRVVQPWAGKAWGQQWIPRVGDEVAVTFLEGDPDCPVVMGGIYNAQNMPVFSLPDNKTQSGILTRSSKGGGPSNFNMLRFEDKMGSEEIHMQAEKDLNSLVKNNETRTVKANRTSVIHVNDSRTVETGNDTVTVQQGARTVTVQETITTTSKAADIITTAEKSIAATAKDGCITVDAPCGPITITAATGLILKCGESTITMTPSNIVINSKRVDIN